MSAASPMSAASRKARRSSTAGVSGSASGAQVRQRASPSFQQFGQVYCRHDMQKLKVLWKASSWCDVASRSVSLRAAAIASSIELLSDSTKFLNPRDSTLTPLSLTRGWADSNV
jgi:hypothetical protein